MNEPKKFAVIWRNKEGEVQQFDTNNETVALQTETRRNGTVYIDTRYCARLRLYNYLINTNRL